MFFRMHRLSDIYFVGGFGTVQWVDVAEYVAATPDQIVRSQPHQALQVMILRLPGPLFRPLISSPHSCLSTRHTPGSEGSNVYPMEVLKAAMYECAGVK